MTSAGSSLPAIRRLRRIRRAVVKLFGITAAPHVGPLRRADRDGAAAELGALVHERRLTPHVVLLGEQECGAPLVVPLRAVDHRPSAITRGFRISS
jgi:hypothetical protein